MHAGNIDAIARELPQNTCSSAVVFLTMQVLSPQWKDAADDQKVTFSYFQQLCCFLLVNIFTLVTFCSSFSSITYRRYTFKGGSVMKGVSRFSALALAVSLTMLLGGSMVSNVYAESDRDGSQKHVEQIRHGKDGKDGKHHKHCGHWGHHKWQMFKGLNLTSAQKEQKKNVMKGHHKEFMEGRIAVLEAGQNLMAATTSSTFDQSAVQKASSDMSAAQGRMTILHAKVFSEVMPILTPDQQAVVQGRLAKSKLRMQKVISKLQSKMEASTK
jgi:Spy/CpxP family protein refolding chaperone